MKRKLPDWIPGTMRQFRQRKRRELRHAIKEFRAVNFGCAWAPPAIGGTDKSTVGEILRAFDRLKLEWSQKEWGK